jgi:5-methylcytosine-specific restriction endonuclease McrA
MKANCLTCTVEFEYNPHSSQGKYCSNSCQGLLKSKLHKEAWNTGTKHKFERSAIRKWLTEDRGYFCAICNLSKWQDKDITLQVDHIDGNAGNNNPNNLRLICPNCHSQTDTFSGRNKGSGRKARGLPLS